MNCYKSGKTILPTCHVTNSCDLNTPNIFLWFVCYVCIVSFSLFDDCQLSLCSIVILALVGESLLHPCLRRELLFSFHEGHKDYDQTARKNFHLQERKVKSWMEKERREFQGNGVSEICQITSSPTMTG